LPFAAAKLVADAEIARTWMEGALLNAVLVMEAILPVLNWRIGDQEV